MRISKLFLVGFLLAGTVAQAGLVSEVVCRLQTEIDGPITEVRDSNFCQLGEIEIGTDSLPTQVTSDPGAGASIETESEALDDGGFRLAMESWAGANALVLFPPGEFIRLHSSASTFLEWTVWLDTPGPIRPGTVRVNGGFDNTAGFEGGDLDLFVDDQVAVRECISSFGDFLLEIPYDVMLGQPFPVVLRTGAYFAQDGTTGSTPGIQSVDVSLYAYELDGTPVGLAETPEPGSLALLGGGLALFLVRLRRRG